MEPDGDAMMTQMQRGSAAMDALLAGYCAGALSPAMQALVASHLALSGRNAGFVAGLESVLAADAADAEPPPLRDRDARLAAIFAAPMRAPVRRAVSGVLPPPLLALLGCDFAQIKWRTRLPGLRECVIAPEAEGEASLYWIKAGRGMPRHTHEGGEVTLVLQGAFRDGGGIYGRGDVAIADADVDHRPVADPNGDCICLAVTDAPLRLTGPVGRIAQRLFGH